jgi:hypothetical protein
VFASVTTVQIETDITITSSQPVIDYLTAGFDNYGVPADKSVRKQLGRALKEECEARLRHKSMNDREIIAIAVGREPLVGIN